jgi:protein gp37
MTIARAVQTGDSRKEIRMGEVTGIEWCDHTFNCWHGCDKVSPGCDNCYAEKEGKRHGTEWGPHAERRRFGDKHWNEPRKWDRTAAKLGERRRVFCASMADVFDVHGPAEDRERLWKLIQETPNLDWLLLTKRPQLAPRFLPWMQSGADPKPWPNVWLGTSVEDQERARQRLDVFVTLPAAVRFLSVEPMLGEVDLRPWLYRTCRECGGVGIDPRALDGEACACARYGKVGKELTRAIDWVICGAESGNRARPMEEAWARYLKNQCASADVRFFLKQYATPQGRKLKLPVLDGRQWKQFPR